MEKIEKEYIDLRDVVRKLWVNRSLFYKVLPIVFVLSCAYTLCLPRYYRSTLQLVPEIANSSFGGGGFAGIASAFGIDLTENSNGDAISPLLYPDLMADNGFVAELFDIRVCQGLVEEGEVPIDTTYYQYIKTYQKRPFWQVWIGAFKKLFESEKTNGVPTTFNPYCVSKKDDAIMEIMRQKIQISIDKKTAVITLMAEAQDPLIAKTLADSVKEHLQEYITRYRTNKARVDMEYYRALSEKAKTEYDSVRYAYAKAYDSNVGVLLRSISTEQEEMERDMQLKYNTYTTMEAQYQANVAKVQERTPAFTVLQGACVPVKHAGPKRMFIVAGLLFLAVIVVSGKILWPEIKKQIQK